LILILSLAFIGCTDNDNGANYPLNGETTEGMAEGITETADDAFVFEGERVSVENIVADLTYRFARVDGFDYTEPMFNLSRDHEFIFEFTPEARDRLWELYGDDDEGIAATDFILVYRDSAFTQRVAANANADTDSFADANYITLSPFRKPVFSIFDPTSGGFLFHRGEFNDWGNANQYYIVRLYDFTTGERLQRPLVTVFSIATEIAGAPRIEFNVNEDGVAGLVWSPVPGATEYAVVRVMENRDGHSPRRSASLMYRTTETQWHDDITGLMTTGRVNGSFNFLILGTYSIDWAFNYYMNHEDGGQMSLEEFIDFSQHWDLEHERHEDVIWYFGVIAMNSEGTSSISNLLDIRALAPQVPLRVATHLNEGGITPINYLEHMNMFSELQLFRFAPFRYQYRDDISVAVVDYEVSLAPSHVWIIMANGKVSQHLVNYHIEMATEQTVLDGDVEFDEEGEVHLLGDLREIPTLIIPYRIEGTPFRGFVQVIRHNEETFEEELLELEVRQEALRVRTGGLQRNVNLNPTEEVMDLDVEAEDDLTEEDDDLGEIRDRDRNRFAEDTVASYLRDDFEIFAHSRLSAFLALQMLNSQIRVNLDDFPEASDHEYLVEAWFEAVLQNPLILGARGMQLCQRTGDLLITYDQDTATQRRQQNAIIERVNEIIDQIITPEMTGLEIQTAINYFLIESTTYDYGALENAASNNFTHVDSEFFDSFTAYGILIHGVGVCSGYADAFTLLARRAGLESVIVTGFLQGSLPHAWNRVNINGQWYTLDVTNNNNQFFPNAFFNLSDQEAAILLTEDDQWMLNRELPTYVATSDALAEYYRYNNRFFQVEEIVDALVRGVNAYGTATYRTSALLTEEQFQAIMQEVIQRTGNPNLVGGHFIGVITVME